MMTLEEFHRAQTHNARIIQKCLNERTTDFSQIKFWENIQGKNLSMDLLCSKWADILACAAIGAIPSREPRGADGYVYYQGHQRPRAVEAKLSSIQQTDLVLGTRGGLYYSTNLENWHSKCAITSHFAGAFDANMTTETLMSKRRDTFLVLFDRTSNSVIDIYRLTANRTLSLLETRRNKGNVTSTIKLSAFINDGDQYECSWPTEGFDKWQSRMKNQTTRRLILR